MRITVVGSLSFDFGENCFGALAHRATDVSDVERVSGGESYFWRGRYTAELVSWEALATASTARPSGEIRGRVRELHATVGSGAELSVLVAR